MRVIIFANGEMSGKSVGDNEASEFLHNCLRKDDYIICCDGGTKHTFSFGILPNLILGDLDSADKEIVEYYKSKNVCFETFPPEKDYTDLELAVEIVLSRFDEIEEILILGAFGGRFDHQLGNVQVLYKSYIMGIDATIISNEEAVFFIGEKKQKVFEGCLGSTLSLIPFTEDVAGITTKGMYYPRDNENLRIGQTRGISNIVNSENASVCIKKGCVIAVLSEKEM